METKFLSALSAEWERFRTLKMQGLCIGGGTLMTLITAALNYWENHPLEDYDQALAVRWFYTYIASYFFLRFREKVQQVLDQTDYQQPGTVAISSATTATATYVVQILAHDPEALASATWTAGASLISFTCLEVLETLNKRKSKN